MTDGKRELLLRGAAELALALNDEQLAKFDLFGAELWKWNRKINLTAITNDTEMVIKHFIDSLTLTLVAGPKGKLLDLGSGGGFPALPLKIAMPELQIVSVDSVHKKIMFQRQAARLMGLRGFEALHARVEELPVTYHGNFDWVVSRAFSDLATFAMASAPYLNERGVAVAMKGRGGVEEARACEGWLSERGIRIVEIREFLLPVGGDGRTLIILVRKKD